MDTGDEIMSKDRAFTGEVKVMRVNAAIDLICLTKQEYFNSIIPTIFGSFLAGALTMLGAVIIFG